MTKRLLSFVAVVAILSSLAFGQTSGKIVGTVYDASQEAPLGFTNVVVQGTSLGAVSDENGRYVILDVPPGTYTLVCTYIGYSPMEIQGLAVTTGLTTIQDMCCLALASLKRFEVIILSIQNQVFSNSTVSNMLILI